MRSQPARTRYRKASRASSNPWAPQPVGILLGPNAGRCCGAATTAENPARSFNTALKHNQGRLRCGSKRVIGTRSQRAPSHGNEQTTKFSS